MSQLRRFLIDPSCVFAESFGDLEYVRDRHTVTGNPTIVDSPWGKAMHFDGANDYVTFDSALERALRFDSGSQDFSIVMYVKPEAIDNFILCKWDGVEDGWMLYSHSGSGIGFLLNHDYSYTADNTFVVNNWYCVVVSVVRASSITPYINGINTGVIHDPAGESMATTANVRIGDSTAGDGGKFTGSIHSLIAYNRALSLQEAINFHNGGAF